MGSSAMGASILKKKVKEAGISDVDVTNLAINNLPSDVDLVVTHKDLTERAEKMVPGAIHVSVDNFLGTTKYDDIVEDLKKSKM
jgi:PTS system mannitol-specific IIC component